MCMNFLGILINFINLIVFEFYGMQMTLEGLVLILQLETIEIFSYLKV